MKLNIVQAGHPVLRQQARPLSLEEVRSTRIQRLIELMRETMIDAGGVGLAAPQIGEPLQLAVIEDRAEYLRDITPETLAERERSPVPFHVIINPQLSPLQSPSPEFFEGCLSLTGFVAIVPRAIEVEVKCLNERAESAIVKARGWHARILQHEIDYLQGRIYIDRIESRSFMTLENYNRWWKDKTIDEIYALLGSRRSKY